jgi:hypothetical protein
MYRAGGDLRVVKDVLGHSDMRMTERYTLGEVPAAMRSATSRFEEQLGTQGASGAALNRAADDAAGRAIPAGRSAARFLHADSMEPAVIQELADLQEARVIDCMRVPRRRALQVLGAAAMAPAAAEGARALHPLVPPQPGGGWRPRFFAADETATVEALAEAIIPETDTPGARTAGVHQYIDWMVSRSAEGDGPARLPQIMRAGLAWLDRRSGALYGRLFVDAGSEQQTELLARLAADPPQEAAAGVELFRQVRRLTISGYYRSEIGMREELGYAGKEYLTGFEGCTHEDHLSWEPDGPEGRG